MSVAVHDLPLHGVGDGGVLSHAIRPHSTCMRHTLTTWDLLVCLSLQLSDLVTLDLITKRNSALIQGNDQIASAFKMFLEKQFGGL